MDPVPEVRASQYCKMLSQTSRSRPRHSSVQDDCAQVCPHMVRMNGDKIGPGPKPNFRPKTNVDDTEVSDCSSSDPVATLPYQYLAVRILRGSGVDPGIARAPSHSAGWDSNRWGIWGPRLLSVLVGKPKACIVRTRHQSPVSARGNFSRCPGRE